VLQVLLLWVLLPVLFLSVLAFIFLVLPVLPALPAFAFVSDGIYVMPRMLVPLSWLLVLSPWLLQLLLAAGNQNTSDCSVTLSTVMVKLFIVYCL
jgi:hypothetical protein